MSILQKIIFPNTKIQNIKKMYYTTVFGGASLENDTIVMPPNAKISFNTYFNSFYEAYWRNFTNLTSLNISLEVKGNGFVSVFRDSRFNGCYELQKTDFNTQTLRKFSINIDLEDMLEDMGRIFIDITSVDKVIVKSIEFVSPELFVQQLTVGICTFNREDFLFKNILSLVKLSEELPNLSKVLIVNQGNDFTNPDFLALLAKYESLIQVYKQPNLGGTGGFTRTLYEASENNMSDFHLLMDDDVIIDSNVIKTAFSLACLAKEPIAVGGQMLDLLRPNILHEYGSKVDKHGYIRGLYHNINVADIANLANFNVVTHIDYNAWWFCMMPTQSIKDITLPAPIFIRGDDEEYGLRLKKNGIETVALPGVALWHESFYVKVAGWQTYYDFRNRMILSSSYTDMKNESPSRLFLRVYNLLLCHDYQSVKLIFEAIKDFAKGTKLFNESSDVIHQRVSEIAKKYMPTSVDVDFKPIPDDRIQPKWNTNVRRINFAKQTALLSTLNFSEKTPKHLWDRHVNPQNVNCYPYVKSNGVQSYHYLYKPNKELVREILKELIEMQQVYVSAIKSNDWNTLDKNKNPEYWKQIFTSY